MIFDHHLKGSTVPPSFSEITLREIIYAPLNGRLENAVVIRGHQSATVIDISLLQLRQLVARLVPLIRSKSLEKGDTVLLASFYCSNELANALLFSAFTCMGIRVFIPIYPEINEFDHWQAQTKFKAVILPGQEIMQLKGHEREKEVVRSFRSRCQQQQLDCWDAYEDFDIPALLRQPVDEGQHLAPAAIFNDTLSTSDEAVIFTTSGSSGNSKLVVYRQGAFSLSCQCWQEAGLFDPQQCGNPGFTPLFTHTIGIRHFINALWTGHPVCILVVDWFLQKPEEARYLLKQMQPGHIVGGPALFNTMIELFRQFPDLKSHLRLSLKTVISIGAPYHIQTARQIKNALGLHLYNAFGTTETQMVLLQQPKQHADQAALGHPLPGVSVGLTETDHKGVYEMHLQSPYQSSYVIWGAEHSSYFSTGDLVTYGPDQILRYAGRKGDDFIKDDFGVKVPLPALHEYYPLIYSITRHVEWLPLDHKPGLAALLFLKEESGQYTIKEISEQVKCRNEDLQNALQPFEFSHRHLERISIIKEAPPFTRKGTVSRKEIGLRYADMIAALKNPYVSDQKIESLEAEQQSNQYKFSDPRLATLLECLRLDIQFEKGENDFLIYTRNNQLIKVLDLVGGFGSGLHGHNHPALQETMIQFLQSGRPAINTQGSRYAYPSLLTRELNKIFARQTGRYFKVQLANTGSEAMEIALHHAYFEWWQRLEKIRDEQLQLYGSVAGMDVAGIWETNMRKAARAAAAVIVVNNCFHGYSASARSLLGPKKQRQYFSGLLKPLPLHVNDRQADWPLQVEKHIEKHHIMIDMLYRQQDKYLLRPERFSNIVAAVVEPVRGEGGIYETNTPLADFLSGQSFPLIADEIQCGLGRTGTLPAYGKAAYYLLGKSLGGGYEKIAAVLIEDRRFKQNFPQYYTSTFANGELAACTALRALQLIEEEDYPATAHRKGDLFREKIQQVAARFPDIIDPVQGRGLMLGIHFSSMIGERQNLLRLLRENDLLGYLFAGWMLHEKNIRVLPSLSKPDSIRVEPSVYISTDSMDEFCHGLEEFCTYCRQGESYRLMRFLMNGDPYLDKIVMGTDGAFPQVLEEPARGAIRVGFIGNFTNPARELAFIEPDLQQASETGLRILFSRLQILLEGKAVRLISKNLMKGRVHFSFYIVPFDTAHLEVIHRWGKKRYYIARIQEAVNRLAAEGCTHISLGAHTSILSGNGLYLAEPGVVKLLTGNTLTVASCLYYIERHADKIHRNGDQPLTIAIAGANGNIGSGLTGCLAGEKYKEVRLILTGTNTRKLDLLKKKLFRSGRDVLCTTDLFALQQADIIISCTSSNDPLIFPWHIHPEKKVFIIDIAVPGSVSEEVKQQPNVEFYRDASAVYLPDDPDFMISTHTPRGKIFCCAGEVMLAALYQVQDPLKGHIAPLSIRHLMQLAEQEGMFKTKVYAPAL